MTLLDQIPYLRDWFNNIGNSNVEIEVDDRTYPYEKQDLVEALKVTRSDPRQLATSKIEDMTEASASHSQVNLLERTQTQRNDWINYKLFTAPFSNHKDLEDLVHGNMGTYTSSGDILQRGSTLVKVYGSKNDNKIVTINSVMPSIIHSKVYGLQVNGTPVRVDGDFQVYHHGPLREANLDVGGVIDAESNFALNIPKDTGVHVAKDYNNTLVVGDEEYGLWETPPLVTYQDNGKPSSPEHAIHISPTGRANIQFKD